MSSMKFHAFGSDPVFAIDATHGEGIDEVVEQLRRCAVAESGVRVGRNAWFINGLGNPRAISVGTDSILRGCLRLEAVQTAAIAIGRRSYLGDHTIVSCSSGVCIGDYVLIAHGVEIYDNDSHPIDPEERRLDIDIIIGGKAAARPRINSAPVVIGDNVWIGSHAKIMKGVEIGRNSIVAAGSIVTKSFPPDSFIAGNPATVRSSWERRPSEKEAAPAGGVRPNPEEGAGGGLLGRFLGRASGREK